MYIEFLTNITLYWFLTYVITLFLFNISPGVSFIITAKNTIKNKSLKIGLFTSLGIATSDGISSIIGFCFCSILNSHKQTFQYIQLIGISYLLYVGIKMITNEKKQYTLDDGPSLSTNFFEAYKNGFLYTFSNIGIAVIIITIISQFYQYVNSNLAYFGLILVVPIMSFVTFFLIACCCYYLKLWLFFEKRAYLLDKIAGGMIILLSISNIKSILGQ